MRPRLLGSGGWAGQTLVRELRVCWVTPRSLGWCSAASGLEKAESGGNLLFWEDFVRESDSGVSDLPGRPESGHRRIRVGFT